MQLYQGDCLDWLNEVADNSIDMCYIDPPFFTQRDFISFNDKFENITTYIQFLEPRIRLIYQKLKPTGSLFLHCDWHASHRLRCLLDDVFGQEHFVNEIIWSYQRWTNASKNFQRTHDNIYFYSKDKKDYVFHTLTETYSTRSKHKSARYSSVVNGKLQQSYTTDSTRKKAMRDVWEISILNSQAHERTGYPTQKPIALLERIIKCSTNPGDTVLDCFGGSGTTAEACQNLNRNCITGDISETAVKLMEQRLYRRQSA